MFREVEDIPDSVINNRYEKFYQIIKGKSLHTQNF